jgi:hypothetical protein
MGPFYLLRVPEIRRAFPTSEASITYFTGMKCDPLAQIVKTSGLSPIGISGTPCATFTTLDKYDDAGWALLNRIYALYRDST